MGVESPRTRFRRWALTVAAVLCAVVSVTVIPSMLSAQHTADFFDADHAAELSVTANVTAVYGPTSGKHMSTRAAVLWNGGAGSDTVELSDNDDVRSEVPADRRMPVVIWHGRVIQFEFAGRWHTTDADPDHVIADRRAAVAVFALAAAVLGRITGHTTTLAFLAPVTLGAAAITLIVLPAIPWMWEPSAPRGPEPPEPERAPHPDYDMRNRPIGKRLW